MITLITVILMIATIVFTVPCVLNKSNKSYPVIVMTLFTVFSISLCCWFMCLVEFCKDYSISKDISIQQSIVEDLERDIDEASDILDDTAAIELSIKYNEAIHKLDDLYETEDNFESVKWLLYFGE